MTTTKTVDPFELHPEIKNREKNLGDVTLSLTQVLKVISNKVSEVRMETTPPWGYDKHHIAAILTGLITELEEKCQHN